MTNRKTCSDLVEQCMKNRAQDFKFWMEFGPEARLDDGEGSNLDEYGLCWGWSSAHDDDDDEREPFYRYQLSWGGPSDEVRFFRDRIEYWYLDWYDGAKVDVTHEPWAAWLLISHFPRGRFVIDFAEVDVTQPSATWLLDQLHTEF